jgi:ABC-type uncharacterized transport system ATPase subunit
MITLTGLTKRFGEKTAVVGLTVEITPGQVTGFSPGRTSRTARSLDC